MFIMTGLDVPKDMIRIYDSSDNTNEVVRLSTVVRKVREGTMCIAGISQKSVSNDARYIAKYGVYASSLEARQEMARLYIMSGMTPIDAYRRAGLQV